MAGSISYDMKHDMDHMDPNMGDMHHDMDMGNTTMDPHHHMDMDMDGMKMFFHFGYSSNEAVLFDGWRINSIGSLIGSMIAVFIIAIAYEGLKFVRQFLMERVTNVGVERLMEGERKPAFTSRINAVVGRTPLTCWHLLQTLLHTLQIFVSYLLMMVFMTYNAWLCIAVVVGAGAGYFIFGWRAKVMLDLNEHCH